MSHQHHHSGRNLKLAFWLNLSFTIFEFTGGLYVNSVAIISDAIHDLGDSLSLGLSWYLDRKSKQGANSTFSFGYARFSLLGALINSLVLIAGSVFVIREAVDRLFEPEMSDATGMLIFALIGVAVNGYAAWKLSSGQSMNERVVSWHLLEDVLGWVAVLIVAIILQFYQTPYLDPALSLFITAYILWNVIRRLRETLMLFLQGAPKQVNVKALEDELLAVPNVDALHHTHIWSLDGEQHVFTTHVKLKEIQGLGTLLRIKQQMKAVLKPYGFAHYTIEVELSAEKCGLVEQ
jgi:cobalt-zinc-cadmium efflux system protein